MATGICRRSVLPYTRFCNCFWDYDYVLHIVNFAISYSNPGPHGKKIGGSKCEINKHCNVDLGTHSWCMSHFYLLSPR
jgi:hypothetical protein